MSVALPQHPTVVVGANVRAEMARRRVLQADLAKHLELPQTAISHRVRGEVPWDINELVAAAELLGVNIAVLLDGVDVVPAEDVPA